MNYEEKYKEALERARNLHKDAIDMGENLRAKQCEIIFPELVESEDERVRKSLIHLVHLYGGEFGLIDANISVEKAIAWLEKQGQQEKDILEDAILDGNEDDLIAETIRYKHEKQSKQKLDKVEPKFKVSDLVVDNCGYVWKIEGIINQFYILKGVEGGKSHPTIEWVNKTYHLWTIQDAKDGDVLVNGSNIFMFHFINDTRLMGYCHVNTDDGKFYDDIGKNECFCLIDAIIKPATIEQYDLLFQKMKEAGYEWDAENKQLNKIHIVHDTYCQDNCKGFQETGKCFADGECKAKREAKQKPIWSEEDEKFVHGLIRGLSAKKDIHGHTTFSSDCIDITETIDWLKSIKDRVQPKQEWSEEDESILQGIWDEILANKHDAEECEWKTYDKFLNWLKSLKPQNRWKPSDEQMNALWCNCSEGSLLLSLYNDLKKLKET